MLIILSIFFHFQISFMLFCHFAFYVVTFICFFLVEPRRSLFLSTQRIFLNEEVGLKKIVCDFNLGSIC